MSDEIRDEVRAAYFYLTGVVSPEHIADACDLLVEAYPELADDEFDDLEKPKYPMTPNERRESALLSRVERLEGALREVKMETDLYPANSPEIMYVSPRVLAYAIERTGILARRVLEDDGEGNDG